MNTENTDNGQQPNPGDVAASGTADTAKPEGVASTETQPAEGQGEGTQDAAATEADKAGDGSTEAVAEGAPEAYADFEVPEGYTLDGPRLEQAQALFKEANLPQAAAQKLVSAYCQMDAENGSIREKALTDAREQQRETWGVQARTELGDQYDRTVSMATTAVQAVNDPALTEAFNAEGWGNHPALIKAFAFFGKSLRDSDMDTGNQGTTSQPMSIEERMYPSMKK